MKRAAIMCRVSSDEQAKGYSLDDQLERLERYCEKEQIEIVYQFNEDHSAKSFDRPSWKEWMAYAKKNHKDIDYLLFTTWDRFARDIAGAYSVIAELTNKYKIQPQAIEQQIDFSIPETKAMLALYLAMPEIDNDRRSIKIRGGIRQALKQGRWIRKAPVGYRNMRDEQNKPIIVPHESNADLIRYAFEAFADGVTQAEIRSELAAKGLRLSKSNFSRLLRRELYIGKMIVPAEGDEPEMVVEAVHQGLISEDLFYRVQNALDGTKKRLNSVAKVTKKRDDLYLRGKLQCSNCGKNLTGSASRGKLGVRYYYYHCNYCRKERYRADAIHELLTNFMESVKFNKGIKAIYDSIVKEILVKSGSDEKVITNGLKVQQEKIKERLTNLQDLLVDGTVDAEDYKSMKARFNQELFEINQKMRNIKVSSTNFENFILSGIHLLKNLGKMHDLASVSLKQKILGSIFVDQIIFDGKICRTPEINSAFKLILKHGGAFGTNKKGQPLNFSRLSSQVESEGFEPSSKQGSLELSTCLSSQ